MIRSVVHGCGAYLPERVVTNDELAKKVDTSDEWIEQRTGIRQRHIAADGQFTSHLAIKASERALAHAGIKASDLGAAAAMWRWRMPVRWTIHSSEVSTFPASSRLVRTVSGR